MEAQSRARDILRLVEIQFKGGFPFSFILSRARLISFVFWASVWNEVENYSI